MNRVVVIGTSQGGVEVLHRLISGLSADFPAPILVVLHIGAWQSVLPSILSEIDGLKASFARQGEGIEAGHIYVAPPDRHMLLRDGHIELVQGPRENWARPAIDPLFRSAAAAFGPNAIGVVLSGRLNDGTAGLFEIKRHGGTAIVQTPSEAEAPEMPRSALENVAVDYCLPVSDMARLLTQLAREPGRDHAGVAVARAVEDVAEIREPLAQTCPECGGAMRQQNVGSLITFRCHTGHAMTAEVVAATQLDMLHNVTAGVLRLLNERASLCRSLAEKHRAAGNSRLARVWEEAARQAIERQDAIQRLIKVDWVHSEDADNRADNESAIEKAAE